MSERALLFTFADQTLGVAAGLGREAFVPQRLLPLPAGYSALLGLTEVRGRTVPLLNLAALLGHPEPSGGAIPDLALLIEVSGELLALPVLSVIGMSSADALPSGSDLLSQPFSAGDQSARLLNPHALIAAARTRLALI